MPWLTPLTTLIPWMAPRDLWTVSWVVIGLCALTMLAIRYTRSRQATQAVAFGAGYGSSSWATERQLRQLGAFGEDGMVLGIAHGSYVRTPPEQNVIVFGPPGEGKSRGPVLATITADYLRPKSMIIVDLTGDLLEKTIDYRASLGPVHVFFPGEIGYGRMNLSDLIRWGTPFEMDDAQRSASFIVTPDASTGSSGAEHYERMAKIILPLGLLYTRYGPGQRCSYEGLLDFFTAPRQPIPVLLQRILAMGHKHMRRIASLLTEETPSKLRDDWLAAAEWLLPWNSAVLAYNTNATTIPWQDLQHGPKPSTLYIRMSPADARGRLRPVLRLVLDQMLFQLTNRPPSDYDHPIYLILDDVAELGRLPIMDDVASFKRKFGFQLMAVFQSPSQAWHETGRFTTLFNACGCWVIYRQNEPDSAKYLAEKLGETTVTETVERVEVSPFGAARRRARTKQQRRRMLLTPGEVGSIPPDKVAICIKDQKVWADQVNVYEDVNFQGRIKV
jgi:type IV secretion system protein VirD4